MGGEAGVLSPPPLTLPDQQTSWLQLPGASTVLTTTNGPWRQNCPSPQRSEQVFLCIKQQYTDNTQTVHSISVVLKWGHEE